MKEILNILIEDIITFPYKFLNPLFWFEELANNMDEALEEIKKEKGIEKDEE